MAVYSIIKDHFQPKWSYVPTDVVEIILTDPNSQLGNFEAIGPPGETGSTGSTALKKLVQPTLQVPLGPMMSQLCQHNQVQLKQLHVLQCPLILLQLCSIQKFKVVKDQTKEVILKSYSMGLMLVHTLQLVLECQFRVFLRV